MSHLLSIRDLDGKHVLDIFKLTAELKAKLKAGQRVTPLAGRTLALIFEKPSLRTRVTFEVGMVQLGGAAVYLSTQDIGPGKRESVPDIARNLSRWVDGIAARVFTHTTLEELARHATIPVINALSDLEHPCQAMNNVLNSLLFLSALMGVKVRAACPPGYQPAPEVLEGCRALGGQVRVTTDAREAAEGADVIYTDVWISMGQEAEREKRLEAFQRYQVNDTILGFAAPSALVMHCLPAHRGDEITDAVLDGPRSIVLDQAENRLHVQKGIVMHLSGAA